MGSGEIFCICTLFVVVLVFVVVLEVVITVCVFLRDGMVYENYVHLVSCSVRGCVYMHINGIMNGADGSHIIAGKEESYEQRKVWKSLLHRFTQIA